ncbi:MAG: TAXI family TRAP transporter solute-binding subunit [Gammaproteobacteria bacterium]|nr:TAXI family TRAP transporter solute-binding subunit [Gammaproteobacteria bacterium]
MKNLYYRTLLVCLMVLVRPWAVAAEEAVIIGGGSVTGVYYQAAVNICALVNKYAADRYNCLGRPSLGSVFNINAVERGLLDFGIAQSDRNWQATHGLDDWKSKGPVDKLRSVFSIHSETVLLVARKDVAIRNVSDLAGKRVNIGNPGSGQRGNALDVLKIYGLDIDQDLHTENLQQDAASRAIVDGKIDAFFFTAGNPNRAISEPAEAAGIRIIPIDSDGIKIFVDQNSHYVVTSVPAGVYRGVDDAVATFGVKATVVTSADVSEVLVYNLVKSVFENLDEFRASHEAFMHLQAPDLLQGLAAPLHPGAVRYFTESGLLPPN